MRATNDIDFSNNKALNVFIEEFSPALPLFNSSYQGRLVFLTVPGPTFGLYYGGEVDWIGPLGVGGGGGGGASLKQEVISVTAQNVLDPLSSPPTDSSVVMLFQNGQLRVNNVDFSISGQSITWNAPPAPNAETTHTIIAVYPTVGTFTQESPTISGVDTFTNPALSNAPKDPANVLLWINGQLRVNNVDYSL